MVSSFQFREFRLGLGFIFTDQTKHEMNNNRRGHCYTSKANAKLVNGSTFKKRKMKIRV